VGAVPVTDSISFHHLLAIIHSELPPAATSVAILDAGCGDGVLLAFLHDHLARYRPELSITSYGFDVSDSGVQERGFFSSAVATLRARVPGVDWNDRLRLIRSTDPWPYADETFDFVISNHVFENVEDPQRFVLETARVLKPGGRSAHLFPLKNYVFERHVFLPVAHWIRDHDALRGYIKITSYLGWGSYRGYQRAFPGIGREEYAERQADFLIHFTRYWSRRAIHDFAQRARLRCSFRYTEHFYSNRVRMLLRIPPRHLAKPTRPRMVQSILVAVLMWVSSITVFLEKKQTYREVGEPSP
jgi:SAM-dependent methyltransferase